MLNINKLRDFEECQECQSVILLFYNARNPLSLKTHLRARFAAKSIENDSRLTRDFLENGSEKSEKKLLFSGVGKKNRPSQHKKCKNIWSYQKKAVLLHAFSEA